MINNEDKRFRVLRCPYCGECRPSSSRYDGVFKIFTSTEVMALKCRACNRRSYIHIANNEIRLEEVKNES